MADNDNERLDKVENLQPVYACPARKFEDLQ